MGQPEISPDGALRLLQEGNERFAADRPRYRIPSLERRTVSAMEGQHPCAAVLSCSDSRVPVGLIFDAGIGEVFVVRVAGNVVGNSERASLEYAVECLQTPLLVVMGHSSCGAVGAAVDQGHLPSNLAKLAERIVRSVEQVTQTDPQIQAEELIYRVTVANVWQSIGDLLRDSPSVRERVKTGRIKVIGAFYNIDSGKVDWLGTHPSQDQLV